MNYAKKKFDALPRPPQNGLNALLGKWEAFLAQQPKLQIKNISIRAINHKRGMVLATLEAKISVNGKGAVLITKVFSDNIF